MRALLLILARVCTAFGFTSPDLQAAPAVQFTTPAAAPNNNAVTGFYNFQTGQFEAISASEITANHIKGAEPVLPASPFNWTISGLPDLPIGSYIVRAEASDIAFNNVSTQVFVTVP